MSIRVESQREILIRGYIKGRIPFRIWFFSSLIGAVLMIIFNLIQHQAILQGFFSVLFLNLAVTIPLFLVQAHLVGKTLQRNFEQTKSVLFVLLIVGWMITGFAIGIGLRRIYPEEMNYGIVLMILNYSLQFVMWNVLSYFTTMRKLASVN